MKRLGVVFVLAVLSLSACTRTVVVREDDDSENTGIESTTEFDDEVVEATPPSNGPLGLWVCIAYDASITCEHSMTLVDIPLSPEKNGPPYAYHMAPCNETAGTWTCTGRFVAQGNDELPFPAAAYRHLSHPPEDPWWCLTTQSQGVVEAVTCGNASFFTDTAPNEGETIYQMGGCSQGEFDGTNNWTCRGTLFRSG